MNKTGFVFLCFIACLSLSCGKDGPQLSQNHYPNYFSDNPFYYHFSPNSFILDGDGKKAVASESIEDVELAAKLGFRFVEANIWETSDGKFVCIHGDKGDFGSEVKSIDPGVITTEKLRDTPISSVSLDWIKTNVRYDSDYEEYQTRIPTLEEFCAACKRNNMGIIAGVAGKRKPVEICVEYLADNVVIYQPPNDIRNYFKGYVFNWNNKGGYTASSLLSRAKRYGPPYICALGGTAISELEERNELEDFISDMHRSNFLVGWAAVYSKEIDSMRYREYGMDVSGSGHEVNGFDVDHEFFDLTDEDHLPSTTGEFFGGVIKLSSGKTITCGSSDVIHLGKGSLSVRFSGTIRISFGSCGSGGDRYELTSDGDESFVFSDYFFERSTVLTITSLSDDTVISEFVYGTALC